jgi:hypothetical protein
VQRLKTDREILRALYDLYVADYPAKGDPFVEIDVHAVAKKLGCGPELLFGRLYYDMGTRLRFRDPKDPNVSLASVYEKQVGPKRNCINFPYVAALLAGMDSEHRRNRVASVLSIIALGVSVLALLARFVGKP